MRVEFSILPLHPSFAKHWSSRLRLPLLPRGECHVLMQVSVERKGALDNAQEDDDGFDVAVEDAIADRPAKRARGGGPSGDKKRGLSRQARDKKFGFGGPGRRSKQNTKGSTDDFEPRRGGGAPSRGGRGGARGGKSRGGGTKRLGKNRRMAARGRS